MRQVLYRNFFFFLIMGPRAGGDGLGVSRPQILRSLPCQETADDVVQVPLHCYQWPWYVGNRQIHNDLGVPDFSDHIRSLTERFHSKLADVGNPLATQLDKYLR